MFRSSLVPVAAALIVAAAVPASAKQLPVSEVESNSVLVDKEKAITYGPELMIDQKHQTMWVEGEGSAGLGKYVEFTFDGEVELAKVKIWGGCFLDAEFWKRHNRIKDIEFKFTELFESERVSLEDKMEAQWITFEKPRKVSKVKVYLRAVYDGSTWNDTPITDIRFYDAAGDDDAPLAATATASSVYGDDADYGADKAVDGWVDSWWVEGGGSGAGETLEVDFGASRTVRRLHISTGFDATQSFFEGSNRARKVILSFDDGSTKSLTLEDKMGLQEFDLGGVQTRKVKIGFGDVVKGSAHDDLYIGEVRFFE